MTDHTNHTNWLDRRDMQNGWSLGAMAFLTATWIPWIEARGALILVGGFLMLRILWRRIS